MRKSATLVLSIIGTILISSISANSDNFNSESKQTSTGFNYEYIFNSF